MSAQRIVCAAALAAVSALCGCASSYSWKPSVPENRRTVCVPTFRCEADITELGAVMARQVAREFAREGTYSVVPAGDAALEVQGIVKSAGSESPVYSRRNALRTISYDLAAKVEVSLVDKARGRVLVNSRTYEARAPFSSGRDRDTAMRDASGRLAEDLARQVVDDALNLKWEETDR